MIKVLVFSGVLFAGGLAHANSRVESIKEEIFQMAQSFQGQGDPDGSKQARLEILVDRLLEANPQAPVQERLPLLYGAWQQIWGPYDYRNNDRGVDPVLDVENIFQVVFEGGYYYNVNPALDKQGRPEKTILLRGEYTQVPGSEDLLEAKFTNLRQINELPAKGLQFQDLPALSEAGKLQGERTVLPGFLVRWFFGGGFLQEVYTDQTMRILFGSGSNDKVQNYIYVMKRVSP